MSNQGADDEVREWWEDGARRAGRPKNGHDRKLWHGGIVQVSVLSLLMGADDGDVRVFLAVPQKFMLPLHLLHAFYATPSAISPLLPTLR